MYQSNKLCHSSFLYIKDLTDWYYVPISQLVKHGARSLINRYNGSLIRALQAIYPQQSWTSWRFGSRTPHNISSSKSKASKVQYLLFRYVQQVSGRRRVMNVDISRKQNGIQLSVHHQEHQTHRIGCINSKLIFWFCLFSQIFLPELSIAFEYNGEYHYKFVSMYL